jgi:hypothetical protein
MLNLMSYILLFYKVLSCLILCEYSRGDSFGLSQNVITIPQGQTEWSFPNFVSGSTGNSVFTVRALRYRVPVSSSTWAISQSISDTGGLFKDIPAIDTARSLNLTLVPFRNGFVRFTVVSSNMSFAAQNFSVLVKEVNQPPLFALNPRIKLPIRLAVGDQVTLSNLFVNISKGGWGEDGQELFFTWEQTPKQAIIRKIDFIFSPDMINASLIVGASDNAWGNATINVSLHDSQGAEYSRTIEIQTYLQDVRRFLNFAHDLPCDIEKDSTSCRQDLTVLANAKCDGSYNWSGTIERQRWTVYTLLPRVASFPSSVLRCNESSSALSEGAYKLRDFIFSKAGSLADLRAAPFTFNVTLLPRLSYSNSSLNITANNTQLRANTTDVASNSSPGQSSGNASNITYFDESPNISSDGTLTFKVSKAAPNQQINFNVSVQTPGAAAYTFILTFVIWQDKFRLQPSVAAFQGSGLNIANGTAFSIISGHACWAIPDIRGHRFYSAVNRNGVPVCDIESNCRCEQVDGGSSRFQVSAAETEGFKSIAMDMNGTLSFAIADDWFGRTNVSVTLLSVVHPETQVLVLTVLHTDEAPGFSVVVRNVTVSPSKGCSSLNLSAFTTAVTACGFRLSSVVADIRAGGLSEICTNCPQPAPCPREPCQRQALSFLVDGVSDPALFSSQPILTLNGSLSFALWPWSRGQVTVYMRLLDDGASVFFTDTFSVIVNPGNRTTTGFLNASRAGTNHSSAFAFDITVQADDERPTFSLSRQVDCTADLSDPCTCPPAAGAVLQNPSCTVSAIPSVVVLENSGEHLIESFVTDISSSRSVANGMTTFEVGQNGSLVNISQRRLEPLGGSPDLSLATSFALSPDKDHVYAAEFQSDTLAILYRAGSDYNLSLLGRRADGESRFRFSSISDFETQNPCHVEPIINSSIYGDNSNVFAVMQGCDKLSSNFGFLPSRFPGDALNIEGQIPDAFDAYTAAFWNFNSYSASGNLSITAQSLRSMPGTVCADDQDTFISPSGFSDSTGHFPAATMLFFPPVGESTYPSACKKLDTAPIGMYSLYQDAPPSMQPSVLTYLANNGDYEAFRFNGVNVGGAL